MSEQKVPSGPQPLRPGGNLYHRVLPVGAVYVGRPGPYGNRHTAGKPCRACGGGVVHDRAGEVEAHRQDLRNSPGLVARIRRELAGRSVACWCPLDGQPCHADTVLRVAAGGQP